MNKNMTKKNIVLNKINKAKIINLTSIKLIKTQRKANLATY